MKVSSSKRRILAAAALVLLALFLLRPGASRLKSRIISSLSAGVGRSVDLGSAHIRLLPRPGFDLDNLVVYDDPAFGAEPMLRASEVTADLRLTSLLRGRLEIARLNLTEPSLNLVHNEGGRWNLAALLERTAHAPTAPTAKAKSEPRPGFPYIEATSARINFKQGPEKTPYALTNADFSLWQESENSWGVRLKAQPVRTDLNLNDTGLLQVSGTWQRAAILNDTPLQFSIEWSRAQLGQVTKFFTGNDQGWRGGILLDAVLSGSPGKLQITSTASVDDFRRYDITSGKSLRLAGSCSGEYSSLTHEVQEVKCSAPVAKGFVTLAGDFGLPGSHRFTLDVTAESVPAIAIVALAQRAKKNLPDDLTAEGILQGKLSWREDALASSKSRFEGRGEIAGFRMASASNSVEFGPETIPFVLTGKSPLLAKSARSGAPGANSVGPHIEFGPAAIETPRNGSPMIRGWVDQGGYDLAVAGEMDVMRALRLGRMAGVPASTANLDGSAQVDLRIAGLWTGQNNQGTYGFMGPQVTGTAKLKNVKVSLRGAGTVEILSADMQLSGDEARVGKINAKAAGATWSGSVEVPRGCGNLEKCPVHFSLNTDDVSLAQLGEWAHPSPKKRAWYQLLEGNTQTGPSFLSRMHGSGTIAADRFRIHSIAATHVSANINLGDGKFQISQIRGDVLNGKHRGKWTSDFSVNPAVCSGSGTFEGISLAAVANTMKNAWIAGAANASYDVNGPCSGEFWQKATGTVQAEIRDGVLPHVPVGDEARPLRIKQLDGQARMHDGTIEIDAAKLDSPDSSYTLSGTATLQRQIDLKLTRVSDEPAGGYAINGTLAEPRVTPLTHTEQAKLKPISSK